MSAIRERVQRAVFLEDAREIASFEVLHHHERQIGQAVLLRQPHLRRSFGSEEMRLRVVRRSITRHAAFSASAVSSMSIFCHRHRESNAAIGR